MVRITDTSAPMPAAFAVLGFSSLHTRNKTRPTTGMQHPKRPHKKPPLSFGFPPYRRIFCLPYDFLPFSQYYPDFLLNRQDTFALSFLPTATVLPLLLLCGHRSTGSQHQENCHNSPCKPIIVKIHASIDDPHLQSHRGMEIPCNKSRHDSEFSRNRRSVVERRRARMGDGSLIFHFLVKLARYTPNITGAIFRICFPVELKPTIVRIPQIVARSYLRLP
mgnify:CR=1 FL=1